MTNKWVSVVAFVALLPANLSVAQSVPGRPALPAGVSQSLEKITGERILEHVRILASDRFEGRAPGTIGEHLTVDYLVKQFRASGLSPGNPDGTFVQKVPLVGYKTTATIDLAANAKPVSLTFFDDFVHDLPRLAARVDTKITGVVFAGYGITAPQFNWDDYKGTDVRNKLVLVLSGEPSKPDATDSKKFDPLFFRGDTRTYYSTREFKYEEARKRGAAGILVITDPEKARTYSLFQTFARMEGMALRDSSPHTAPAISGLVTKKAGERLFTAAGRDLSESTKAADDPRSTPISMDLSGRISVSSKLRNFVSQNVVARIQGSDPDLKNEYVIYSAHWDHLGKDESLTGDQIYNGANDNAAGTAQLIEVGAAFASLTKKPKRSILILATTSEEKGYLGARFYARNPLYPKMLAAINLDAGNLFGLTKDLASAGYGQSTLDGTLETAAEMQGRTFLRESLDGDGGYYFASDQIEFAKVGVPAVFPWNGHIYVGKPPDFGEKRWNDYGTNRYHQVTDEVMADWDMAGAVEDARWMMLTGLLVANNVERPSWSAGSEYLWLGKKLKRQKRN